jgi:hypothetical protein
MTNSINLNNPRYLGMSEYQSSNSLQNSTYVWSFPKSHRFSGGYKNAITDTIYNLPEHKNERYTTQGYGKRTELLTAQGRNSPPPNTYRIKSFIDLNFQNKKGMSIHEKVAELVK